METTTLVVFAIILIVGISSDLYAHKGCKEISFKDATVWSIIWVLLSVIFGGYVASVEGTDKAHLFFTGYLLEKALSVDNLFVFMAIFAWFKIPNNLAHRVLYWGILGAIVFRLIFVVLGTTIMGFSHWVEVFFGLIVIWSGYKLLVTKESEEEDYSKNIAYIWAKKFIPVTSQLHGDQFFIKDKVVDSAKYPKLSLTNNAYWCATPLFLCLIIIELSDILFAFDSVPAILAVTKDPTIVWPAMILAMCGLRTMYFMLDNLKELFVYLEKGVILILFFIGSKLIINSVDEMFQTGYNIHNDVSLLVVSTTLLGSILLSVIRKNAA